MNLMFLRIFFFALLSALYCLTFFKIDTGFALYTLLLTIAFLMVESLLYKWVSEAKSANIQFVVFNPIVYVAVYFTYSSAMETGRPDTLWAFAVLAVTVTFAFYMAKITPTQKSNKKALS